MARRAKTISERERSRNPKQPKRPSDAFQHLYQTRAWKRLRQEHLAEHPYCEFCQAEGKPLGRCVPKPAIVDHIKSHNGAMELFLSRANLRTLCRRHHSQKTCREDGGFGNTPRSRNQL